MFRGATVSPKANLPFGSVAGAVVAGAVDCAPAAVAAAPAAVDAGAGLPALPDELLQAAATNRTAPATITPRP
jgi:hypothetical protein